MNSPTIRQIWDASRTPKENFPFDYSVFMEYSNLVNFMSEEENFKFIFPDSQEFAFVFWDRLNLWDHTVVEAEKKVIQIISHNKAEAEREKQRI